jgi:hypothetical protein
MTSSFGFSPDLPKSLMKNYGLWELHLGHICRMAGPIKVRMIMYTPEQGEFFKEDATLDGAIHEWVVGHHQPLLVISGKTVV